MKIFIAFLFGLMTNSALSSGGDTLKGILPLKDGKVFYSGVIRFDSIPKKELHNLALRTLLEIYHFDKNAILINDKEAGLIVIRDYIPFEMPGMNYYHQAWHSISVFIRNNQIRYEISNFQVRQRIDSSTYHVISPESYKPMFVNKQTELYKNLDRCVERMLVTLKEGVMMKDEEDW